MKTLRKSLILFLAVLLLLPPFSLGGQGANEDENGSDFLYMINVGKGDAILIRASGRYYLIDCGKSGVWEKVEAALNRFGVEELEGVFLTHSDKDHSGGLKKLARSELTVSHWYASEYYTDSGGDHPMAKAIKKLDATVEFLKAGDRVDDLFTVLAPLSPDTDNEDNNSLVILFDNSLCRVLLTGDMEGREEYQLLQSGASLLCDVFKVPNHADDDVCVYMDLSALGAKAALISTDPYEKPGTPDPLLLERLSEAGMEVFRTDCTLYGIWVALDGQLKIIEE